MTAQLKRVHKIQAVHFWWVVPCKFPFGNRPYALPGTSICTGSEEMHKSTYIAPTPPLTLNDFGESHSSAIFQGLLLQVHQ